MRAFQTDLTNTIAHLPSASVLILEDVTWDQYEQFLEEVCERPGIRTTYNRGRLEIVTTSLVHERWKEFILLMVHALGQNAKIPVESGGGFTQKRKKDEKGTEADTCFYIANATRIIGKEGDINVDPPPDIVVEVDKANQSLSKFPIYATFGVPEIWRCHVRRKRIQIFELREQSYVEIPSSRFLPILTGDVLVRFIEQSLTVGQTAALSAFQDWVRNQ